MLHGSSSSYAPLSLLQAVLVLNPNNNRILKFSSVKVVRTAPQQNSFCQI